MSRDPRMHLKKRAGEEAATLVEHGMVVGLGTGTTASFVLDQLGERWRQGLRFIGIPTSAATEARARSLGLDIGTFAGHRSIDLTIDGADEIERGNLNLLKGRGGALLREKIVAAASRQLVVVADDSKLVERLGERTPVSAEASDFGWEVAARHLGDLGACVTPRRGSDGKLFTTDGGNVILDCQFAHIDDPEALEQKMKSIVGIFECGLFIRRTALALVATKTGIDRLFVDSK